MLLGKAIFPCPIDGKEVTLDENCINCKHFQHWGIKGSRPYVSCKIQEEKQPKTDPTNTKKFATEVSDNEKKGIGNLKRW